ncbi:Retrovirus-related Pol polyprotein from transposon 17.6 [Vitis vinifera]|uniref:Retrovirus-related Pol polyprotein from transposon 17.6 n=1 Tax=Vitis vinifera TaxID=29760 RepID=A0A438FW48_VITVI|nr:Retrovirus-related Pol polyprotein from transposon 17.6 [Vitis vinifera]
MGDFDVRRILIDPGSSTDLLQASVINHMGLELSGLENLGKILSRFNGAATTSLGDIVLPVQAGPVTLNVQFSVVEDLSPFNAILGCMWLHYMKVILSTYHQMVSFLTEDGQIDQYGSQLAARQCYQIAREKVRRFHPDRQKITRDEVDKLLEAGFIREVEYLDWLENVVVVPKKEGKWRVCIDYTNLNNACPKNSFPLPLIDQIVDSTVGQGMLSFLDAFSGYHQNPMALADEEKTAFITSHGLYCYKVMSFGLKNVGATYQRLMTKIFKPLVGRTVEYGMKLNPFKCAFGMSAGKFLGFMVNQRGIEVSLDQVKAVMETPPSRSKKELQRLIGKIVALGRFIARFTDELRPFFLVLRKVDTIGWTDSCQSAFEKIKHYLTQPPILSSPLPGEKLYMYLVVSDWAISAVLFYYPTHREQKPIYYVSRALVDAETRYSKIEQTALALRSAAQKLYPYFQAHPVVILTDQPLRNILHKSDLTGRMLQWAIELKYSQKPAQDKEPHKKEWWTLRVDGASRSSGSGVGLLLQSPTGEQLEQAIRLGFPASNNEAKYEAILSGLDLALALSVSKLQIYSNSQLVVRHVQEEYRAKDERMAQYLTKVRDTLQRLGEWTIEKFSQTDNVRVDALEDGQEWMEVIAGYLWTDSPPEKPKQEHKIRVQATRFTLIGEHLYKRSFTGPYLRCLDAQKPDMY